MISNRKKQGSRSTLVLMVLLVVSLGANGYLGFKYFSTGPSGQGSGEKSATAPSTRATHEKTTVTMPASSILAPQEKSPAQALPEQPAPKQGDIKRVDVEINQSISHTLQTQFDAQTASIMAALLDRVLGWELDFNSDMRKGDRLQFLYVPAADPTDARILAATYTSQKLGRTIEVYHYKPQGEQFGSYFKPNGAEIHRRIVEMETPIKSFDEITSRIGEKRRGVRSHNGIDFKTPVGTPVYAPFNGTVLKVNWNFRANGDCIKIEHPAQGADSLFLHLNKVDVKAGQRVTQGQKIGESGNTGHSFAPHLHYELRELQSKKVLNPLNWKHHRTFVKTLGSSDQDAFMQKVQEYKSLLTNATS